MFIILSNFLINGFFFFLIKTTLLQSDSIQMFLNASKYFGHFEKTLH